jgi:methyltransferase (TIGR00027 family)
MDLTSSKTALLVASYRARASARENALIHDPWAEALAGSDGARFADAHDAVNPAGELYVAIRTAFLDAQVARLTAPGGPTAQVVMLGAGFDVRAARLARPGVRFFEVDHPHTQDEKRARLRALPGYPADCATYVPCDFERDDFLDRLVAEGFDAGAPAAIVWEGVIFYLTEQAARATLRRIASGCHASSVVLFDYVQRKIVEGRVKDDDEAVRHALRELGEPLRFGCDDMLPLLYEEGFRHVRLTSFDEACLGLTGTYERARKFRFQHLAVASRGFAVEA